MPNGLDQAGEQALANLSALAHFGSFDAHRRRLTALLLSAAPVTAGRLCVLGAGNCFDLDLAALVSRYHEIHLVDIDASALERAFAREEPKTRDRLVLHGAVDISGLMDR